MKVKRLLDNNWHKVNTISPDTPISDTMKLMSKNKIDVLVVSEKGKMVC